MTLSPSHDEIEELARGISTVISGGEVEKIRGAFEEWFEECTGWEPVEYPNHKIVAMCWLAWKASREAIEIVLPEPHAHLIWIQAGHAPDDYWDDVAISRSEKDRCCDGSERYPVYAGWEIEETLRTAGLKVRS